ANLRDMFSRTDKDKIPPDLKLALTLLNLTDLAGLEAHFLATTAFLAPWAAFRDSCLLVNKSRAAEPSGITRLDILWFYTQFDEGLRRHDPRTEKPVAYFEIDKSEWGPAEFEKHLYAWLLQTFCVGKTYSPFGLRYFELRNICTAWEEVFVPIIRAVRASYSVKGRRHYGRLALFIEDRCPSRLAFPEGNITMPDGVVTSPTPFRMVSRPSHLRGASQTVLTKKNYDETEKELRNVYPQYGGLVERPRFKQKMEEWLEEQRVRAARRKTIAKSETVQYVTKYQPQVVQQSRHNALDRSLTKSPSKDMRSRSPIKRYSDSICRSLTSVLRDGIRVTDCTAQELKSPLHGVTRHINIPDDVPEQKTQPSREGCARPLPAPRLPRPEPLTHRASEQRVYMTDRSSSPSNGSVLDGFLGEMQRQSADFEDDIWSPMGALSAIPRPLKKGTSRYDEPIPDELLQEKKSYSDARHPSYEGNGYQEEISLSNLHARNFNAGGRSIESDKAPSKPHSRLPAPIRVPPPYVSQLRVASNDTYRNDSPPKPKAVPWPGNSPPKQVAWLGYQNSPSGPSKATSAFAPPIPAKSPERWASKRGQRSEQLLDEEASSHEIMRIVSKENIRAALGNLSSESSMEDLRATRTKKAPTRVASPPRLETFNTHMFPRKDVRSDGSPG
ncbi:hypothetical protein BU25DRAFT_469670, partial [Macroventuria anomochaeta]